MSDTLRDIARDIAGSNQWRTNEGEGKPYGVDLCILERMIVMVLASVADSPEARAGAKLLELQARLQDHTDWGPQSKGEKQHFMALALSGEAGELADELVLTLAICGKAGKLANLFKKDWRGDTGDRTANKHSEMGDIGAYLFIMSLVEGIDIIDLMLKKAIEVEQRPEYQKRKAIRDYAEKLQSGEGGCLTPRDQVELGVQERFRLNDDSKYVMQDPIVPK